MSDLRIGGLASGIDTEQIISELMKAEKTKVDKLEQSRILLEWRQETYNDLNLNLANFILDTKKDLGLSRTTSTGSLVNSSVNSLDWIKTAVSSDESVASVSSYANAIEGSFDVNVKQLADNVTMASASAIGISSETSDLKTELGYLDTDIIHFTVADGSGNSVEINGLAKDLSISDIVSQINNSDVGITAAYDSGSDRFFIQTDESGKSSSITIEYGSDNTTDFFDKLNLEVSSYQYTDADDIADSNLTETLVIGQTYQGVNAVVDFAGANDISKSSNQFSINNINLDIKDIGSFSVSVNTDIDAVYDKISNFVESYNELVEGTYEKLREKRYRDYSPLTDEQKSSMEESDIELWEEKAKSGLLRNDMVIEGTMQRLRSGLYEEVEGATGSYSQITEIGITTESYSTGAVGKLVIDEKELREAIQDDVDSVLELFFKQPSEELREKSEENMTVDELERKRNESGLINRLYDDMIIGMKSIINKAGPGEDAAKYRNVKSNMLIDFVTEHGSISMIDDDILDISERIDDMYYRLDSIEDRYWAKFTAMEQAMSKMNSQSDWLYQQMSSM